MLADLGDAFRRLEKNEGEEGSKVKRKGREREKERKDPREERRERRQGVATEAAFALNGRTRRRECEFSVQRTKARCHIESFDPPSRGKDPPTAPSKSSIAFDEGRGTRREAERRKRERKGTRMLVRKTNGIYLISFDSFSILITRVFDGFSSFVIQRQREEKKLRERERWEERRAKNEERNTKRLTREEDKANRIGGKEHLSLPEALIVYLVLSTQKRRTRYAMRDLLIFHEIFCSPSLYFIFVLL